MRLRGGRTRETGHRSYEKVTTEMNAREVVREGTEQAKIKAVDCVATWTG